MQENQWHLGGKCRHDLVLVQLVWMGKMLLTHLVSSSIWTHCFHNFKEFSFHHYILQYLSQKLREQHLYIIRCCCYTCLSWCWMIVVRDRVAFSRTSFLSSMKTFPLLLSWIFAFIHRVSNFFSLNYCTLFYLLSSVLTFWNIASAN